MSERLRGTPFQPGQIAVAESARVCPVVLRESGWLITSDGGGGGGGLVMKHGDDGEIANQAPRDEWGPGSSLLCPARLRQLLPYPGDMGRSHSSSLIIGSLRLLNKNRSLKTTMLI